MSNEQNWRVEDSAETYFGHQKKTLAVADRRPVIRRASDIVGPGINAMATRITDYNDILATYNGYYSSEAGASNAPNSDEAFVGITVMDSALGGYQQFTGLDTGTEYRRIFTRNPSDPDMIFWGAWVVTWEEPAPPIDLLSSRYRSSNQTISDSTTTTISYDQVQEDDGIPYSSGVWTIPLDGRYLVNGQIQWAGSPNGNRWLYICKNGAIFSNIVKMGVNANQELQLTRVMRLEAGDTISFMAAQASGGNLAILATSSQFTFADITYLGA